MESFFKLGRVQVCVNDVGGVLKAAVDNVQLDVKQRPSANALRDLEEQDRQKCSHEVAKEFHGPMKTFREFGSLYAR
ncbi:Vacuolar protein sorting-associated protein (Vps13) [Operophtera brumata]|uniref:Vacuolar protein sorting-associated protein (Vps13) n=1 Tax=Operophtera brumata TaxID=104452 RepID=A0A0L7LFM7_OPEBR|nr:Vacuolar protein sorting-associated protein (Vps13) [Operophtera brumata]